MGIFSSKRIELENEYAMMESEMLATPKALMKGLGIRDMNFKASRDMTADQMQQVFEKLFHQKQYNLMLLRDYVAKDQKNFFATGKVNIEIRHMFENIDVTDSIVIQKRINQAENYKPSDYSERVLWDYFNDLAKVKKHAFCVAGNLNQIDNLILLNLKHNKQGEILKDGSCFFPVKLYEKFFTQIKRGNNVVVL